MYRSSPSRSSLNTSYITGLDMCEVWFGHVWSMYRRSPFRSSLNTSYITGLDMCEVCTGAVHSVAFEHELHHRFGHVWSMYRSSPFRSSLNTSYITGLDMCEVCTEAVHAVALWHTRTASYCTWHQKQTRNLTRQFVHIATHIATCIHNVYMYMSPTMQPAVYIPVVPHEAAPEVSKGKVHIAQNKHVPIEIDCGSTFHSISHVTLSWCWLERRSKRNYFVLLRTTQYYSSTTLYYTVLLQY